MRVHFLDRPFGSVPFRYARLELKEMLRPGQKWTKPGPLAFFFPLKGVTRNDYEAVVRQLTSEILTAKP